MSRRNWSTSNFLRYSSGLITTTPLTICAWAKTSITATNQLIAGLYNTGGGSNRNSFRLILSSPDTITASISNASGNNGASTSTTITANTWFHACAVFASATSYSAYLNGSGKGTGTTSTVPSGINRTAIGASDASTVTLPFAPAGTGDIAEVAMWSIALSDRDVATLATGVSPLSVHPESLVGYWPLIGNNSPENNIISNTSTMSIQGTLTASAHPRVLYND